VAKGGVVVIEVLFGFHLVLIFVTQFLNIVGYTYRVCMELYWFIELIIVPGSLDQGLKLRLLLRDVSVFFLEG
jgi:hypothetical protein